jgi:hypothetical protein
MLHYRQYQFNRLAARTFGDVYARILSALEDAGFADAPIRFMFEDRPGVSAGCTRILERFPEMEAFAIRYRAGVGGAESLRLTNFDRRWEGVTREVKGEVARATLLAIARGIPDEFPLAMVTVIAGPLRWVDGVEPRETAMRTPRPGVAPFSARIPIMTYLAPCVILQRSGSGLAAMWAIEQLSDPRARRGAPAGIEKLAAEFGAPRVGAAMSVQEREVRASAPLPPDAAAIHTRHRDNLVDAIAALKLPHQIPDARESMAMQREPLGQIRSVIVKAFAADGWKRATGRIPPGTHQLWKATPSGRQLVLTFDTGSWSRHVVCTMGLVTERGALNMPVPADALGRMQYLATNRETFTRILDNLRVVAAHLEQTWVRELEAALGPPPPGYEPPPL